jgi:hypothetical protein
MLSLRVEQLELKAAITIGDNGLGLTVASIPVESFFYPDLIGLPDSAEVQARITQQPASGTFYVYEDGQFFYTGYQTTFFTYSLYVDGLLLGSTRVNLYSDISLNPSSLFSERTSSFMLEADSANKQLTVESSAFHISPSRVDRASAVSHSFLQLETQNNQVSRLISNSLIEILAKRADRNRFMSNPDALIQTNPCFSTRSLTSSDIFDILAPVNLQKSRSLSYAHIYLKPNSNQVSRTCYKALLAMLPQIAVRNSKIEIHGEGDLCYLARTATIAKLNTRTYSFLHTSNIFYIK